MATGSEPAEPPFWQGMALLCGAVAFFVIIIALIGSLFAGGNSGSGSSDSWPKCERDPNGQYLTYTYKDGFVDVKDYSISAAADCND